MRTKTLLIAAAALAATVITSQAQVYSANVVGYASVVTPDSSGNILYMEACPFAIGVSNGADEVYGLNTNPGNLPIGTTILLWNPTTTAQGAANTYTTYYYDPTGGGSTAWWDGADESFNLSTPVLSPGKAYFIQPAASVTNTFSGTIAVSAGATNTTTLSDSSGNILYMVGSAIPFTGDVTNASGINLGNMPVGTTVLLWNPTTTAQGAANTYTTYYYDPTGGGTGYWWDGADENNNVPDPTLPVGGGLFIQPASTYNWAQTLSTQ